MQQLALLPSKSIEVAFKYRPGDIVWGVINREPAWPARIVSLCHSKSISSEFVYEVDFLNDDSRAYLDHSMLLDFEKNFERFSAACTGAKFREAVRMAKMRLAARANYADSEQLPAPRKRKRQESATDKSLSTRKIQYEGTSGRKQQKRESRHEEDKDKHELVDAIKGDIDAKTEPSLKNEHVPKKETKAEFTSPRNRTFRKQGRKPKLSKAKVEQSESEENSEYEEESNEVPAVRRSSRLKEDVSAKRIGKRKSQRRVVKPEVSSSIDRRSKQKKKSSPAAESIAMRLLRSRRKIESKAKHQLKKIEKKEEVSSSGTTSKKVESVDERKENTEKSESNDEASFIKELEDSLESSLQLIYPTSNPNAEQNPPQATMNSLPYFNQPAPNLLESRQAIRVDHETPLLVGLTKKMDNLKILNSTADPTASGRNRLQRLSNELVLLGVNMTIGDTLQSMGGILKVLDGDPDYPDFESLLKNIMGKLDRLKNKLAQRLMSEPAANNRLDSEVLSEVKLEQTQIKMEEQ